MTCSQRNSKPPHSKVIAVACSIITAASPTSEGLEGHDPIFMPDKIISKAVWQLFKRRFCLKSAKSSRMETV